MPPPISQLREFDRGMESGIGSADALPFGFGCGCGGTGVISFEIGMVEGGNASRNLCANSPMEG